MLCLCSVIFTIFLSAKVLIISESVNLIRFFFMEKGLFRQWIIKTEG